MASLTPGVLTKLLDKANSNANVSGHRSALLQVTEIVPSLVGNPENPWQSKGFFLKVSDSLHSTYVSINQDDLDLIYSNKLQLGQFIYASGLDFFSGSPVPVLRGLKPVPLLGKRQPCVGNPKELVSGELLSVVRGGKCEVGKEKKKGSCKVVVSGGKKENGVGKDGGFFSSKCNSSGGKDGDLKRNNVVVVEGLDVRRLSLDSARRVWDHQTPKSKIGSLSCRSSGTLLNERQKPPQNVKSEKKDESSRKLKSKNAMPSPELNKKASKKDPKSDKKNCTIPSCLVKVPLKFNASSEKTISWNALPPAVLTLGKATLSQRDAAISAAACALEEASAAECVIRCMKSFAELRESSQKIAPEKLLEQYLDVYQIMQRSEADLSRIIKLSESKPGANGGIQCSLLEGHNDKRQRDTLSWVHAAIETNFSRFTLFEKREQTELLVGNNKCHYVVLETSKENKPGRSQSNVLTHPSAKPVSSPSIRHTSSARKMIFDGECIPRTSRLRDTASLVEKMLSFSREWFLEYMEELMKKRFGESSEIGNLLKQLKRVGAWLDDLSVSGVEVDEKVEGLSKKICAFVLEHVDSAIGTAKLP